MKWTLLHDWILLSARLIGQKGAESIHLDNCRCKLDELMLDKMARLVWTNVVIICLREGADRRDGEIRISAAMKFVPDAPNKSGHNF